MDSAVPRAAKERPRWRQGLTWPLRILGAILLLIFLAWLILYITKGRFLKPTFVKLASQYTERQVQVGGDFNLYFNPFHIQFLAEDISISSPDWARDDKLFDADRVDLQLNIWKLIFGGNKRFNYLNLVNATAGLERQADRNTWTFRSKSNEPFELPDIVRASITGTRVHYIDRPLQLETNIRVGDVAARDTVVQARIPFEGNGTSRGAPFTMSGALSSPNATLAGGENKLNLTINVRDSRVDVVGTLPGATQLEGSDLRLTAQGANLKTPFTLLGVVIPDTRRYRITSKLTLQGEEWRFTRMNGRFGDSDLAGRMTISMPKERLLIDAALNSRNLDILDAGPWVGYSPQRLDAQGGKGAIREVGGRPRVLPDAPLASESLSRFDARVRYRATNVRTGTIPIRNLEIDLGLDRKLLTLKPVAFDLAGGRLTGDIDLNARQSPVVTDYDVRLSPVRLKSLLAGFDIEDSGTTGTVKARLQLRGFGDTVRESLGSSNGRIAIILPQGTFWIRNTELIELDLFQYVTKALAKQLKDPTEIRCGLLAFTVRRGTAIADPIFIDTQRSVIRGRGSFSFADEALDMSIEADSKKFSLFSGQSPIGINGYFAEPRIDVISPELIQRGVVGVGLGAVLSPIAAILAFVDPGEEKDTNCAPILAGARTPAVRAADKAAEGKKDDSAKQAEKARKEAAERAEEAREDAEKARKKAAEKTKDERESTENLNERTLKRLEK